MELHIAGQLRRTAMALQPLAPHARPSASPVPRIRPGSRDSSYRLARSQVVRDHGTSVEVSDGVKNGDQVILNPPADLVEGQTVNSHCGVGAGYLAPSYS
jgi:hypothetical protein